ncbi:outer membrane beta-barrel protein [Billgrantia diversa]|uniref:outer membrane beta-barrel protein n=1 Tax=Halomonas sp. MCCC 1A13316 TaxID=2733487 RepID=UPI0018A4DD1B|nr:outer membrane beta-barrel protein [Halomonas sp. MCCC 1A13316]QOR37443.1 outer membrane beta-barrel protein [Halomonas sp. MCCC 1A13316]
MMPFVTLRSVLLILSLVVAAPASALEPQFYFFGSFGAGEPDLGKLENKIKAVAEAANGNGGVGSHQADERDEIFSLGIGLQLHRYFAIELSYLDLGSYELEANGSHSNGQGEVIAYSDAEVEVRGYGLHGVVIVPVTERFSGDLALGIAKLKTEVEGRYTRDYITPLGHLSEQEHYDLTLRDTVASVGVGTHYAFTDMLGLRLNYRYYGGLGNIYEADESIDVLSIGLTFHL